jgi:hypothetical protein
MIYFVSAATAAMFGYMLWSTLFRLRHDRVKTQRSLTRGKFAFRTKDRARFLLDRSFDKVRDKPDWEDPLIARLNEVALAEARKNDAPQ